MRSDAQAAPVDQSPHDHRKDILVYQTPPLDEAIEVTGPIVLRLWAASSCLDTDWTAKLAVVFADDPYLAEDVADQILLNVEELPALLHADQAPGEFEPGALIAEPRAAQRRADAGHYFIQREGLRHVVVGACIQTAHPILYLAASS